MHTFGADEPYVKWHTMLNAGWMVSGAKNTAKAGTKSSEQEPERPVSTRTPGDSPLKHGYNFTVFTHTSCGKGVTIWCLIVWDMFLAVALYSALTKKEKRKKGKKGQKRGWEVWVGGKEKKKRIELHLLFLICRLGSRHSWQSSDQWSPAKQGPGLASGPAACTLPGPLYAEGTFICPPLSSG